MHFKQSISNSLPGICAHRAGSKTRVPDSNVVLFPQKRTCLTTVCAADVPLGFLCLNDRKRETTSNYHQKKKNTAFRRAVARRACASSHSPFSVHIHPVLSHGHKNLLIDCGDDLLNNDLLLSSSALLLSWLSVSVSVRSPFMPSTSVSRSHCRKFVPIVAVTMATFSFSFTWMSGAWSVLRSSLPSGSRRGQRACHPSTFAEYRVAENVP